MKLKTFTICMPAGIAVYIYLLHQRIIPASGWSIAGLLLLLLAFITLVTLVAVRSYRGRYGSWLRFWAVPKAETDSVRAPETPAPASAS